MLPGLTSSDARTVHTFTCTCFEAPPWNLLPGGESLFNLRSGWRPENCPPPLQPTTALGNETHNVAMARELSPSQICPQRPHKQRLLSTTVVHRSQPPCPTTQPPRCPGASQSGHNHRHTRSLHLSMDDVYLYQKQKKKQKYNSASLPKNSAQASCFCAEIIVHDAAVHVKHAC